MGKTNEEKLYEDFIVGKKKTLVARNLIWYNGFTG